MRASIIRRTLAPAVLLALIGVVACSSDSTGPVDENEISMRDNSFSPQTRQAAVGTTVRWINRGAVQHNTTSDPTGLWASDNLNPGESFQRVFNQVGTFAYECTLHQGMIGTVVVQ